MSFTAIDPAASAATSSPVATGAAAAAARVAELQSMIAQAQGAGSTTFASALSSAQAATPTATATAANVAPAAFAPAAATAPASSGSSQYDGLIQAAAARYGIDPAVLHGLIQQESGFDPNSTSGAGAVGLAQLMPGTASSLGVTNPLDPAQSIDGGAHYLREQLDSFGGDVTKALAAYNAGPGAVQRYGGVPPYAETQDYVQKVLGYANAYRTAQGGATAAQVAA
jgi:soluble lytic murein transglycosylase-like protein